MTSLSVYVTEDCWTCAEARRMADKVTVQFPNVEVSVVDAGSGQWPSYVFAAPTYVLDDRVIFLGNPSWTELTETLKSARRVA